MPNAAQLYKTLSDKKFDQAYWGSLPAGDLLRADFKAYQAKGSGGGGGVGGGGAEGSSAVVTKYGVSSVLIPGTALSLFFSSSSSFSSSSMSALLPALLN